MEFSRLHPVIIKINHTLSTIINDARYHWHKSATYLPSIKDRKASIKDVAAQCQAMPVLQSLFSQRSPFILLQPISLDISFYDIPIIRCTSIKPFITLHILLDDDNYFSQNPGDSRKDMNKRGIAQRIAQQQSGKMGQSQHYLVFLII